MSNAVETLGIALSEALSTDQRVLLVEPSFEFLSALATCPVRELVIISPDADTDAPAGETATGARLKMRADYRERPRSKDLIVDLRGISPAEEIERLLKKNGTYVTCLENDVTNSLPEVTKVTSALFTFATVGALPKTLRAATKNLTATEGPSLIMARRQPADSPSLVLTLTGHSLTDQDDHEAAIEEARAALLEAQAEAAGMSARLAEADEALTVAKRALADADGLNEERRAAHEALRVELTTAQAEYTALSETHRTLEDDYDEVRSELARLRFDDAQATRITERADRTIAELKSEIETLRTRLIQLDGPAADLEAVNLERTQLRETLKQVLSETHEIVQQAVGGRALPVAPVAGPTDAQSKAVSHWFEQLARRAETAETRRQEQAAQLKAVRRKAKRLEQRNRLAEALRPTAEPPMFETRIIGETTLDETAQVEALNAALSAERALRLLAEDKINAIQHAASRTVGQLQSMRAQVIEANERVRLATLDAIVAQERSDRIDLELSERDRHVSDLEAMIATYKQMHGMMVDAVTAAESGRDEADQTRRMAESNLEILRGEFERLNADAKL